MFKIFLPQNNPAVLNNDLGIFRIDIIPPKMTGLKQGDRLVYDANKCTHTINSKLDDNTATLFQIDHLNNGTDGRQTVCNMLEMFHHITNYSRQTGIIRLYPMSKVLKNFSTEQVHKFTSAPYKNSKLNSIPIIKMVQFIACWAFPYTTDWGEWETTLSSAIIEAKQYQKTVYAASSLIFHPGVPYLRNRVLSPERINWMIQKAYEHKYDGLIFDSAIDPSSVCYETLLNILNQINE